MLRPQSERRTDPRKAVALRGLVLASGLELPCRIVDISSRGYRIRLDRAYSLPRQVVVIDVAAGEAAEAQVVWTREGEIGLLAPDRVRLRGLTPSRFIAAREAWLRAGGR